MAARSHEGSLSPFTAEGLVGEGGIGRVYLVRRHGDEEEVALKVIHPSVHESYALAVLDCAAATGCIASQHVVSVLDTGRLVDGRYYIALEHLRGADFGQVLANGPMMHKRANASPAAKSPFTVVILS